MANRLIAPLAILVKCECVDRCQRQLGCCHTCAHKVARLYACSHGKTNLPKISNVLIIGWSDDVVDNTRSLCPYRHKRDICSGAWHQVSMKTVRIITIGDPTVGKTSLLITYTTNKFPTDYVPTVFDNYDADALFNGEPFHLVLHDTAGGDEYDKVRQSTYQSADVILLCVAVNSKSSFDNVTFKWRPEIQQFAPHLPVLLVGTKADQRHTMPESYFQTSVVNPQQGFQLMQKINAAAYIECSAITQTGVREVFTAAVKNAERAKRARRIKKRLCPCAVI